MADRLRGGERHIFWIVAYHVGHGCFFWRTSYTPYFDMMMDDGWAEARGFFGWNNGIFWNIYTLL